MVKLFHFGAAMNTRLVVLLLVPLGFQLPANFVCGIGYGTATTGVTDKMNSGAGGQYASTKDNAVANTLTDYLKGYHVGMNDFGHQNQRDSIEYQTEYGNKQNRYGGGGGGGEGNEGSDARQSHISAGYHNLQPRTYHHHQQEPHGSLNDAYEVSHQSDSDKFEESNFSHQYEEESGGFDDAAGGYHSTNGNELSFHHQNYHESQTGFSSPQQHQHTDVINYVPYPVVKKLHVPYAQPVQIPVSHAVIIPVRKPVPINIPITKQVHIPVEKELKIPVERLVPYPVEKQVPVTVEKHVPYPVVKYVPVKVPKPYAVKVPVVRTVVHKVKQQWW